MKSIIRVMIIISILFLNLSLVVSANPFATYSNASVNSPELETMANKVIGIIQVIGTVISICVLLFIGMKFMLASPSEKADLKGALVPYIVGAVLLFASANIASIIYKFSKTYVK